MTKISFQSVRVDATRLREFTRDLLMAENVAAEDAEYVAWLLVETNLRGTDSHGVARLPHYLRRLQGGSIQARPNINYVRKAASAGILDGDHGLGHVTMRRAADEAADMALETGAGWVSVHNSNHCGALGPLGVRMAERGMIGLLFTHVDPMVLPHGAVEPFCGTNPICLSAPGAGHKTFCLDMATSIVPWNIVANAQSEGVPISKGWAVDKDGRDTTNAQAVNALYPVGGHKGSGLGLLIDIFCAMLSGSPFGPDIPKMYGDMAEPRRLGGLVGAININAFTNTAGFEERVAEMALRLGQLKPGPGTDRVRYPGEPELETKELRQSEGIPIGVQLFAELNIAAANANMARLEALQD